MTLQYFGKTAIITGAGGAIGRSYALELAKRGCSIIVNDVGSSLTGASGGEASDPAGKVVREILAGGGKAVANYESVLQADKIVESALKSFGRCDIVINNAGILRDKSMAKMTKEDWRSVLDVHLEGTFGLCHAVWPVMQSQKYGRIVNVGSGAGLYGNFGQANYSSAKMAILGLTNTLAVEGDKYNIKVNCVVPVAGSRMTETVLPADMLKLLDPAHITPIVTYLAHESSEHSGSCFEVGGGWYSQVRFQRSQGVSLSPKGGEPASAETLAANMSAITDFSKATYPTSPASALQEMIAAQERAAAVKDDSASASSASTHTSTNQATLNTTPFPSDAIFKKIQTIIDTDTAKATDLAAKMKARVAFNVTNDNSTKKWILQLVPGEKPAVVQVNPDEKQAERPNVTLGLSDDNLVKLSTGALSPEYAYMRGWLDIKGQMGVALKVKTLLTELN